MARWRELGFHKVHNVCEDFYAVTESGRPPPFDVLVTNPPYSGDHKEAVLRYCLACGRPWALLLPAYVATKRYFGQALSAGGCPPPLFLLPGKRYEYSHPEGTGHAQSPFESLWIVGAPSAQLASQLAAWARSPPPRWPAGSVRPLLQRELAAAGAVRALCPRPRGVREATGGAARADRAGWPGRESEALCPRRACVSVSAWTAGRRCRRRSGLTRSSGGSGFAARWARGGQLQRRMINTLLTR